MGRPRVLVVSQGSLSGQVGGTSIRALELARVLETAANVTLAGVGDTPSVVGGIPAVGYHPQAPGGLTAVLAATDVVVATPGWPVLMRALRRSGARLVFDLYVPEALETVGGFPGDRPRVRALATAFAVDRLLDALRCGSSFVCAGERQRDLLLGMMLAERLITPARVAADPSLRSLIDVVPFGLPDAPAVAHDDGPRTAFPERIGAQDEIVLWNGGLWPWLDAETAIRAVADVVQRRPGLRLVFMGAADQLPARRAAERAKAVAVELGVLDDVVLFNEAWIPYERRADWLLAADCAISTHVDQIETRFAFRTRLLDCFWARLPVVCTEGDDLGEVVDRRGGGIAVPPGDVRAVARGIERVLEAGRATYADALDEIAARYAWSRAARPLLSMTTGLDVPPLAGGAARTPAQTVRRSGYLAARGALNAVGLRDWPRLS